jgi:hypothetical protein
METFDDIFDFVVGGIVTFILVSTPYNRLIFVDKHHGIKDDVSEYIKDYFRDEVYNWISHEDRIGKYNPERGSLDNYLTTLIRNYMGLKKQYMIKDSDYKKLVLKKYYRDRNLNAILDE